MKTRILLCLLTFTTFSALNAQLTMPYVTGFDNIGEQAGWQEFRKGVISQFEEWGYENSQVFSAPTSLVHYYPVGGADPMDDWFVSPAFDISAGGALDSLRYYFSGFGTPQNGDTVFIYLLNGAPDPDLATSATILHEFSGANYQNDNTWRLLSPINLPAQAGNSYIALRYKTINNWLDVRFDNMGISRVSLAGIDESVKPLVNVYPNPVVNNRVQLQFEAGTMNESSLTFELYTISGQLIHSSVVSSGNTAVDLSVAPGFYTYQVRGLSAIPVTEGKLIVQ